MLTKAIPYNQGIKMYLNMCFTYVLHSSVGTKCISNLCWPNPNHTATTQNVAQHELTEQFLCQQGQKCMLTPSHGIEDSKCITIVGRTQHKLERAQNPSQYTPPMRAGTNNFNMYWSNPTHSIWDTCPRIHARTQSVSQYVMTQNILCQIGQKMFLNMCLPKPLTMPARTQCISQHELTKNIQC